MKNRAVLLALLGSVACSSDTIKPPNNKMMVTLETLSIAPATAMLAKGETTNFTASGLYSDNTTKDLTAMVTWSTSAEAIATITASGRLEDGTTTPLTGLAWSSSDENVAVVENGVVTAVGEGTAAIEARENVSQIAASASISVNAPLPRAIAVEPEMSNLAL